MARPGPAAAAALLLLAALGSGCLGPPDDAAGTSGATASGTATPATGTGAPGPGPGGSASAGHDGAGQGGGSAAGTPSAGASLSATATGATASSTPTASQSASASPSPSAPSSATGSASATSTTTGTGGAGDPWSSWGAARDAHGPMGVLASFEWRGGLLELDGELVANATSVRLKVAPLFPDDRRFVYFPGATVQGLGTGLVVLEGGDITLASPAGILVPCDVATFTTTARLAPREKEGETQWPSSYPAGWEAAGDADFFTQLTSVSLAGATVSGYSRGILIAGTQGKPLGAQATLSAASMAWDADSVAVADALDLQARGFALGLQQATGWLDAGTHGRPTDLRGLAAGDASLRFDAGALATREPFRLTQAITPTGTLLTAQVQAVAESPHVSVPRGGVAWAPIRVRESGYVGDAVLAEVRVAGPGASAATVPLSRPSGRDAVLVLVLDDLLALPPPVADAPFARSPLGRPLQGPVAWQDTLCGAAGCAQGAYGSVLPAGAVERFGVRITGDLPVGTHDLQLSFVGLGHPTATVDLRVTVT